MSPAHFCSTKVARSDFGATADSAWFSSSEGRLFGAPVVTSRDFILSGDSVRTIFSNDDLDSLVAQGNAQALGDDLRLQAGEILIKAGPEHVERAWAYGDGRSIGATGRFVIVGDSLEFAFSAGEIDSVVAVGTARAFQMSDTLDAETGLEEPQANIQTGADWIAGDNIRGWFEPDDAESEESAGRQMKRLLAEGSAGALFSGVRDSTTNVGRSRNYIRGSVIDIQFVAGEAEVVNAEQAIGVYVEPEQSDSGGSQ